MKWFTKFRQTIIASLGLITLIPISSLALLRNPRKTGTVSSVLRKEQRVPSPTPGHASVPFALQSNWVGPYRPCLNSAELKTTEHMSIGVRYDVSNRVVIQQFQQAFKFWTTLLDADFHQEQSTSCAIAVVDGTTAVLTSSAIVARAQLPDRSNFQGWIAVDPKATKYLSDDEAIAIWIHEIGHLFGLKHNASSMSVMYALDVDGSSKLDSQDLRAISLTHALRPIRLSAVRVRLSQ